MRHGNGSIPENTATGARRSDDPAPRIVIGWGADGCQMYLIYSKHEIARATLGLAPCIYDIKIVTGRFDYLVRLIFDDS
mgnify:FL=1